MLIRLLIATLVMATALLTQDTLGSGTYRGTWTGAAADGEFHLTLKPDGSGKLAADVGFTIAGQEVPCKVISLKIDGGKIEMTYEFDLQGNKLQSSIQGTLTGKTLAGTYKTTAPGVDTAVDEGTWKTTVQ